LNQRNRGKIRIEKSLTSFIAEEKEEEKCVEHSSAFVVIWLLGLLYLVASFS
jgi:hypothetical protein